MTGRIYRVLLYSGTFVIVVGTARVHAQFVGHYYFHSSARLPWTILYATFLCVAAYSAGLPDEEEASGVLPAIAASIGGAIAVSVVQLAFGSILLPRFVVFIGALLVTPWFVLCSHADRTGRTRGTRRDRAIFIGDEAETHTLETDLLAAPERPVELVGTLHSSAAHSPEPSRRPLVEGVIANRANVIVLGQRAVIDPTIVEQAAILHESGVRVRTLSSFYDEWLGKLPVVELQRMSLMFDVGELHRNQYGRMKRLTDVAFGAIGILVLCVALPVVFIGNVIANHGPLLYRQRRVGRNSQSFTMLKFRTMVAHDAGLLEWTHEDDGRVTRWGSVLRRTHLDELPQVINVLRGEQSVVGPRPEQPHYVERLRQSIPYYDLRHLVRPGLTGWAQVKFGYGASELDALEKLQYDLYYLRHQSLTLDLRIAGRTLRSIIGAKGR